MRIATERDRLASVGCKSSYIFTILGLWFLGCSEGTFYRGTRIRLSSFGVRVALLSNPILDTEPGDNSVRAFHDFADFTDFTSYKLHTRKSCKGDYRFIGLPVLICMNEDFFSQFFLMVNLIFAYGTPVGR